MNPRSWVVLAILLVTTACATDGTPPRKVDASDTGSRITLLAEDAPPLVIRPPVRRAPVEVTKQQYYAAMAQLAARLRNALPPRAPTQVAIVSWGSPGQPDDRAELVREYYQWCEQRGTPGDCLGLLQDSPFLTDEDKQALAFALATRGVWDGTAAVIDEVLDPVQLQIALVSSITMTLALLAIPEPISKVIVPGLSQASRMATAEGLSFEVLGAVRSVQVTGRILTVSMESNALLMSNQEMSGGGSSQPPRPSSATATASSSKYRLTSIESWRKPRCKTTVRFDKNGFPEFEPKFETLIDDAHIGSGKHLAHFKAANEKLFSALERDPSLAKLLGLGPEDILALPTSNQPPPGFRWHHHQDVGRMQLVRIEEHQLAGAHTGGMAIWGGGYPR